MTGAHATIGLTQRQADCLQFVRAEISAKGIAPSFDEIAVQLGVRKSNAHRLVHALVERGVIQLLPGRARTISLVEPGVNRFPASTEAGLALLVRSRRRGRAELIAQAVAEFVEREVRP